MREYTKIELTNLLVNSVYWKTELTSKYVPDMEEV